MADGLTQIIAAPFKLIANVGYTVAGIGTGDKELFKKGLRGTVDSVVDVPAGVLNFAGGCVDAVRPGEYRVDQISDEKVDCGENCNCDKHVAQASQEVPVPNLEKEAKALGEAITSLDSKKEEVKVTIEKAEKTNETLTATTEKAEKTDEKLNETIAKAEEVNRKLEENLKKSQEQENDTQAEPTDVVPTEPLNQPSSKGNWIPWVGAAVGLAAAVLFRGKIKNLWKAIKDLFRTSGAAVDDVAKVGNETKLLNSASANDIIEVVPTRTSSEVISGAKPSGATTSKWPDDFRAGSIDPKRDVSILYKKQTSTTVPTVEPVKPSSATNVSGTKIRTQEEIDIMSRAKAKRMAKAQREMAAQKAREARKLKNAQKVKEKEAAEKLEAMNRAEAKKAVERAKRKHQKKVEQGDYIAAKKRNAELTKQADEQNKKELDALKKQMIESSERQRLAQAKLAEIEKAEQEKIVNRALRKNQAKVDQRKYIEAKKRNAELTKQADEQNKAEMTKLRSIIEQRYAKKVENPHINNVNRNPEAARDIKRQLDEMADSTTNPIKNNEFPRELLSGGNVGKPMGTLEELRPDLAAELDKLKFPTTLNGVTLEAGKRYRISYVGYPQQMAKNNKGLADLFQGIKPEHGKVWSKNVELTQKDIDALMSATGTEKLKIALV